jgi:hypothetical protein
MSLITIIATVLYAVGFPIFVEARKIYYRIWDILIEIQKVLIDLANLYLWPWVADFLRIINFESIKKLYQDIKEGKIPEQCVSEYLDRAGPFEYVFILTISTTTLILITNLMITPLEENVLNSILMKKFVETRPILFRVFFYPFLIYVIFVSYYFISYALYALTCVLNQIVPSLRNLNNPKKEETNLSNFGEMFMLVLIFSFFLLVAFEPKQNICLDTQRYIYEKLDALVIMLQNYILL